MSSLPALLSENRASVPRCLPPQVWYGQPRIPSSLEPAIGGIVKFQRMQDIYPNSPARFNILYMVSSQPPRGAVALARLARRKGAKVVWNQDGVAYPAWHGPGWQQANRPMARLIRHADYVFYQSQFCKDSADRYLGARSKPWDILYNAVDTTRFTPATADRTTEELVLLLGGTQYQWYRVASAIEVLARVVKTRPATRLLITGRLTWTPDEALALEAVKRLAQERQVLDRLTLVGPYTQVEAPDIFRRAHILLHTKYNDPSPGLVIEAMACGLPVVYSCSGGVPEIVGQDAGVGVPAELSWEQDIPPDPNVMAEAVVAVASRLSEYSRAARERAVSNFDLDAWLLRHQQAFEELLT